MSYLEQILTRKSAPVENAPKEEGAFNLKINFQGENNDQAKSTYEKHKVFGNDSVNEDKIETVAVTRLSKKIRKWEKEQTAGDGWYNMKKNSLTQEDKDDLNAIKLRGMMDPKRPYKKLDWKGLPQYYQIGTVMDGGDEPKSQRLAKKDRKGTIIDQFLQEDKDLNWSKGKFKEIQQKKKNVTRKNLNKFKRLKKKGVVRA